MPAPEWGSFLSIVDGSLNPVPVSDLDRGVLKELMAENCGLTLHDLKKRSSEYPSVTTTSDESYDDCKFHSFGKAETPFCVTLTWSQEMPRPHFSFLPKHTKGNMVKSGIQAGGRGLNSAPSGVGRGTKNG